MIAFAEPLLENSINKKRDGELIRLIASAYYGLGDHAQSIVFFQRFLSKHDGLERAEQYYLADAYFYLQNYEQAIGHFEALIVEKDSLSQYAAHQLAKTYLKQGEQQKAINAFKFASSINFDYAIKEDAAYNLVKLVFQNQDSYENALGTIEDYIKDFPLSLHIDEVKELLIKSYTKTRDYKAAVDNLSQIENLNLEQQAVFQKLSYYLALEYFINKDFEESFFGFQARTASKYQSCCHYWMAEAYYQIHDY